MLQSHSHSLSGSRSPSLVSANGLVLASTEVDEFAHANNAVGSTEGSSSVSASSGSHRIVHGLHKESWSGLSPKLPSTLIAALPSQNSSRDSNMSQGSATTHTRLAAADSPSSPYSVAAPANPAPLLPGGATISMESDSPIEASNQPSPSTQERRTLSRSTANGNGSNLRFSAKQQPAHRASLSAAGVAVPHVASAMNGVQSTDYRQAGQLKRQQVNDDDSGMRPAKVRVSSTSGSRVALHNVHANSRLSPRHPLPHYQQYSQAGAVRRRGSMNEMLEEDESVNLEDLSETESDLHSDPHWNDGVSSSSSPHPPSNPSPSLFGIRNQMAFTLLHPAVFVRYQYLKGNTEENVVIQAKHTPVFCFRKETGNVYASTNAATECNTANENSATPLATSSTATGGNFESAIHAPDLCTHLVRQSDILQVLANYSVEYDVRAGLCVKLPADFLLPFSSSPASSFALNPAASSPSATTLVSAGPISSSVPAPSPSASGSLSSSMDVHGGDTDLKGKESCDRVPVSGQSSTVLFNMREQEFLPLESFDHLVFGQGVLVSIYVQACNNSRGFFQQINKRLMNIEHSLQQQPAQQETNPSPRSPTAQSAYAHVRSRGNSPPQHPFAQAANGNGVDDPSAASAASSSQCAPSSSSTYPMKVVKKKLSSAETIGDILDRLEEFHRIAAETGSPTEAYKLAGFAKGTISGYRAKIKEIQDEIGADLTGYRHMTYRDLKKMVRSGRHAANLQFSLAAAAAGGVPPTMPPHPSLVHPSPMSAVHHAAPPTALNSGTPAPISSSIRPWKSPAPPMHSHSHSLASSRPPSSSAGPASHLLSYSTQPSHHSAPHAHHVAAHENVYTRHYVRS